MWKSKVGWVLVGLYLVGTYFVVQEAFRCQASHNWFCDTPLIFFVEIPVLIYYLILVPLPDQIRGQINPAIKIDAFNPVVLAVNIVVVCLVLYLIGAGLEKLVKKGAKLSA